MKKFGYGKTILLYGNTILPHGSAALPHAETILPHGSVALPHAETILPHAEIIPAYIFMLKMCGSAVQACPEIILPLTPKGQFSLVKIPYCVWNDRLYIEFGKRD